MKLKLSILDQTPVRRGSEKMLSLAKEFMVDEIVVATFADSAEDRLRSYELLSEIFDLKNEPAFPAPEKSFNP